MFIDASVLTAILIPEADARQLNGKVIEADAVFTSGIAIWETARAVARSQEVTVADSYAELRTYLARAEIVTLDIGLDVAEAALNAHHRFGKGRHPAQLNMGDCFSYACARVHGVPLLYKGDDFALTDIEQA